MADVTLFMFPGACSRVSLTALEQTGVDFDLRMIDIMSAQQKTPDYLAINPKGKVPALLWHGQVITENPAILWFLASQFPDAGILPRCDDPVQKAHQIADLSWCASTMHPIVRQIINPVRFTTSSAEGVKEDGMAKLAKETATIAATVDPWWYGSSWSIIDAYLCWVYALAEYGGFPLSDYPEIKAYLERAAAWPSYHRALQGEAAVTGGSQE